MIINLDKITIILFPNELFELLFDSFQEMFHILLRLIY
jgi:hypothetical protein